MSANNLMLRIPKIAFHKIPKPLQINVFRGLCEFKDRIGDQCYPTKNNLCTVDNKGEKSTGKSDAASTGSKGGPCPVTPTTTPVNGMTNLNDSDLPKSLKKIKTLQERFQREDGAPVFLKKGITDQVLYRLTVVLALCGLVSFVKLIFWELN